MFSTIFFLILQTNTKYNDMKKILVLSIVCMLQMGVASAITNNRVEMQPSSIANMVLILIGAVFGCLWFTWRIICYPLSQVNHLL